MKPERYGKMKSVADIDAEISAMIDKSLPEANENHWFTPRVMNRLPAQSRWARISLWQWVCYALGIGTFVAIGVMSGSWLINTGLSMAGLVALASMGLLAVICAGIVMTPSLVRILREP